MVYLYLNPLRKYIASSVKIEDQIRGRRAIWLIEVKNYLRTKIEFNQRMNRLTEIKIAKELELDRINSWKLRLIRK